VGKNSIQQVISNNRDSLNKLPGVFSVGVDRSDSGELCICVYGRGKKPRGIPKKLEGYQVKYLQRGG
jgi:hypothetical protein